MRSGCHPISFKQVEAIAVVLAINKMDLIGYDERRFTEIERDYRTFATNIGLTKKLEMARPKPE